MNENLINKIPKDLSYKSLELIVCGDISHVSRKDLEVVLSSILRIGNDKEANSYLDGMKQMILILAWRILTDDGKYDKS